jgi:hypothetical protein
MTKSKQDAQGTGVLDDEEVWEDTDTLGDARKFLRAGWVRGVECPCCKQFVKVYKRKLDSVMASSLVLVYHYFQKNKGATWVHLPRFLMEAKAADRECAKLRYWGLLEEMPREVGAETPGRTSGLWRITDKGKLFVEGDLAVPKYVWVFDGEPYKSEMFREPGDDTPEEVVTIREALGDRFDYTELMAQGTV